MRNWQGCVLHHSGSRIDNFKSIQNYHTNVCGWLDIGYHFIITREGEVLKGRSLSYGGCHGNKEANLTLIGICCLGNMEEDRMSVIQQKALFDFLTYLKLIFDWGESGIFGHKEVRDRPTSCPGKFFPLSECKEIFTNKGGELK